MKMHPWPFPWTLMALRPTRLSTDVAKPSRLWVTSRWEAALRSSCLMSYLLLQCDMMEVTLSIFSALLQGFGRRFKNADEINA
jgi:hypothetical protein